MIINLDGMLNIYKDKIEEFRHLLDGSINQIEVIQDYIICSND